jgi:tetratricopeptide (TPR) repeat protein
MSTPYLHSAGVVLAAFMAVTLAGCATPDARPDSGADPEALWESANRRHNATVASIHEVARLKSDYEAVIRLTRDGELRGRAYLRLAELSSASGDPEASRENLEQALRSGMAPDDQRVALLELGFILDQRLRDYPAARAAYQQLINEHPDSEEAALARLRMQYVPEGNGAHDD